MSLRSPLLSRWLSHPAELLHSIPMLKPTPRSLLFMRHNQPMSLAGPSRAFSLGRTLQNHGRALGRVKGSNTNTRARIDPHPIRSSRHQQKRPFSSSRKNPESLTQRLRKLSREYGWAALGVYLLLTAIDFPFCFMAVRLLGSDRIGHYEHVILQTVADGIHVVWPGKQPTSEEAEEAAEEEAKEKKVKEAEAQDQRAVAKKKADEASIWTQVALAYAIHKSLIFIRVPLTAAITPKVVKVLRTWGVDIARRRP